MNRPLRQLCLAAAALSLASLPTRAALPLPAWLSLEFQHKAFWATAESRVAVSPAADGNWSLRADSDLAGRNSEVVTASLRPDDGSVVSRARLSIGKDRRQKSYQYLPEHILRERRVPGPDAGAEPAQWPVSSRRKLPYPAEADSLAITDSYALLLLASSFLASGDDNLEVAVHTDFNFYRVVMTRGPGATVAVNYRYGDEQFSGDRETRAVKLSVTPLGTLAEDPDFSLLGLHGNLTLLFDEESGLPVQLRGTAPRLGRAELNLSAAAPRAPGE